MEDKISVLVAILTVIFVAWAITAYFKKRVKDKTIIYIVRKKDEIGDIDFDAFLDDPNLETLEVHKLLEPDKKT